MSGIWSQTEAPEEIEQNSDGRDLTENEKKGGEKKAARCKSQRREPPPLAQSDLHSGLEQVDGGTLIICSRPANASVFESFLCSLTKKVRTGNKSVKPEERVCCGTFLLNQTEAPGGEQGGLSEMTSNIGGNKRNAKTSFSSLDENFCMKQFSSECFSSKFPSSLKKKKKHVSRRTNAKMRAKSLNAKDT